MMMMRDELVANLTGQPPPEPPPIQDDGKAEKTKGCNYPARKKYAAAAKDQPEESGTLLLLSLDVIKPSDTENGPAASIRRIEFQADSNVLSEIGEAVKTAFEAYSAEECLEMLPPGRLKDRILSLTGQPGRKRTKLDHLNLEDNELVYRIVRRKSLGVGFKDQLLVDSIEHTSLVMRNDYDEKPYKGNQRASFIVQCRDLYDVGNGVVIVGPSYRWPHQYVENISPSDLKKLYYELELPCLAHDGTTLGDVINIHTSTSSSESKSSKQNHLIFSGFSSTPGPDDIVLGGDTSDIPLRVGSGISFTFDQWPHTTREIVSGYGNPSLRVCHGFVAAMAADGDGNTVLSVRLALGRGNLPPYLVWTRMAPDALFQTNLQVVVPARCVVSTFLIKPLPLHCLAACLPESAPVFGAVSTPLDWDVYVNGHIEFELGAFQGDKIPESEKQDERWKNRYVDSNTMAFALLHDFCARGGPVTEEAFKKHHAPWKEQYMAWTDRHQRGRHLPKATVSSIAPFPVEGALSTIYKCARLIGYPLYDAYLGELRSAVNSFALLKAKRTDRRQGGKVSFTPNIPGSVLLQLVHRHVCRYTPALREGAVEAVVDDFAHAAKLLETDDGQFDLGQLGMVQFKAPITFRWVHYEPRKSATESRLGPEGRSEIIFTKYVAKDRHGGELTGELYDAETQGQGREGAMNPVNFPSKARRQKRIIMLTCARCVRRIR
jgi:hypothetical protein